MDYYWRAKCSHYKIKEIDSGFWEVWVIVGGLWWLFFIVICFVFTLCDLYAILVKYSVCDRWDDCKVLKPIINAHENINWTDRGGVWGRVWGLMEKGGIYIVVGVMVGFIFNIEFIKIQEFGYKEDLARTWKYIAFSSPSKPKY